MATDTPLLDLVTTKVRKYVRIDGVNYEVRLSEDLSLAEGRRLNSLWRRLSEIERQPELSDEQSAEYAELLSTLVALALVDVPASVVSALSVGKRKAIVVSFFLLSAPGREPARAENAAAAAPSTGRKPSRGSRGSTAARRRTGSKTPPAV